MLNLFIQMYILVSSSIGLLTKNKDVLCFTSKYVIRDDVYLIHMVKQ